MTPVTVPFEIALRGLWFGGLHRFHQRARTTKARAINCPLPSTMSAKPGRDHHARRLRRVRPTRAFPPDHRDNARKGTMFHPVSPAPCFIYRAGPRFRPSEIIYPRPLRGGDLPGSVLPPRAAGILCGKSVGLCNPKYRQPVDGPAHPHPGGAGGLDGATAAPCCTFAESATRFTPHRVWETRNPWVVEHICACARQRRRGSGAGGAGSTSGSGCWRCLCHHGVRAGRSSRPGASRACGEGRANLCELNIGGRVSNNLQGLRAC